MKKENKSLFLYTALIFLVSIIMILIAFVGQTNTQNMQPETDSSGVTITDKVNQLSDENRLLLEERIDLTRKNEALNEELDTLKAENELLNKFLQINEFLDSGDIEQAQTIYDTIDPTALNENQSTYYNKITQKINK